jgi:hypothetical protein
MHPKEIYFCKEKLQNKELKKNPTHCMMDLTSNREIYDLLHIELEEDNIEKIEFVHNNFHNYDFINSLVYLYCKNNIHPYLKLDYLINLEILELDIKILLKLIKIIYPPNLKILIINICEGLKHLQKLNIENLPYGLEKIIIVSEFFDIISKNNIVDSDKNKIKDMFNLMKLPFGCKVYYIDYNDKIIDIV